MPLGHIARLPLFYHRTNRLKVMHSAIATQLVALATKFVACRARVNKTNNEAINPLKHL